jgi:hypothetical protein
MLFLVPPSARRVGRVRGCLVGLASKKSRSCARRIPVTSRTASTKWSRASHRLSARLESIPAGLKEFPKSPGNAGAAHRAASETAGTPGGPSGRLARRREPRRLAPGRAGRTPALRAGAGGAAGAAAADPPGPLGGRGFTQGVLPRSLSGVREAAPAAAQRLQAVVLRK